jgi:hypothetical protein
MHFINTNDFDLDDLDIKIDNMVTNIEGFLQSMALSAHFEDI